jgi:hypothetical protein
MKKELLEIYKLQKFDGKGMGNLNPFTKKCGGSKDKECDTMVNLIEA